MRTAQLPRVHTVKWACLDERCVLGWNWKFALVAWHMFWFVLGTVPPCMERKLTLNGQEGHWIVTDARTSKNIF